MTDDLDLFSDRYADSGGEPDEGRAGRRRRDRAPKRKLVLWSIVTVVGLLIAGGAYYGVTQVLDIGSYDDYSGQGEADVVIQVNDGESTGDIAETLHDADVVASAKAFVKAGEDNSKLRGVQPGFYQMKTKMSGSAAVTAIINKDARVGELQIRAGAQLDDVKAPDGSVVSGIISKLSRASCAKLNGKDTCVSPEDLRKAAETADLAALGVPDWAVPYAKKADAKRRLEGLVLPDVYDVKPGSDATELWKTVLGKSALHLQAIGMPSAAKDTGFTPYEVLVMASLIEREAITTDFPKVSRVTYNRLAEPMKLGYDSTINYVLDRPAITTKGSDRAKAGPYNTYDNFGLTPTPISAPSNEAVDAAVNPTPGKWMFFVKCEKDGTSCFAVTDEEHQRNVEKARANHVF
jgi:UPF0755 protein